MESTLIRDILDVSMGLPLGSIDMKNSKGQPQHF